MVDYPYDALPFRAAISTRALFVARSVLLAHHFSSVRVPEVMLLHQKGAAFLTGTTHRLRQAFKQQLVDAGTTLENADLVNVANEDDQTVLAGLGFDRQKIAVIPYGLTDEERRVLAPLNRQPPATPTLCFLGTFDDRKGGADLPRLFAAVHERVGACRLRLIGTAGFHQTRERVLKFFPARLREFVEVVPRFRREELPGLLEGCSVGIFPSYVEGFGLAVLEMMMAGIPVVAYKSPGPPMMLPDHCLTPRGDVPAMTARVLRWLGDEPERQRDADAARQRANDFQWDAIGVQTAELYRTLIGRRSGKIA